MSLTVWLAPANTVAYPNSGTGAELTAMKGPALAHEVARAILTREINFRFLFRILCDREALARN
jgi:hypothetical protein